MAVVVAVGALVMLGTAASAAVAGPSVTVNAVSERRAPRLSVEVASYDVAVGPPARFAVGVFTVRHLFVGYGTVEIRFRRLDPGPRTRWSPAQTASFLALPGVSIDKVPRTPKVVSASEGRGVYATQAAFDREGFWEVEVRARINGKVRVATAAFRVLDRHLVPAPGEPAPATANLTLDSPGVPRAAIDSRASAGEVPDPELHGATIAAELLAGRPVLVVFSTPTFCTSRMCGPVTEMVEQLARDYADRATFVHVEIWREFEDQIVNDAAREWLARDGGELREPWVFLIGADGRIAARWDNVATRGEIEPLLDALPIIGP